MLVLYLCIALGGTMLVEQAASSVIMEYSRFIQFRSTVEALRSQYKLVLLNRSAMSTGP